MSRYREVWPIDAKSNKRPERWSGWPDQKRFALILTHDVETEKGLNKCYDLIQLEKRLGFISSFNFVAEDYRIPSEFRQHLLDNGFEIGVHGLSHDGKLYLSRKTFERQAARINQYLTEWKSAGFRSPSMHHNLEWIRDLNIEYDASTFDTDPFEPKSQGMGTIYPFVVSNNTSAKRYVELPYTLPQDFTLYVLFKERSIDIWKKKLDWIAENGGMALMIVHPDYMSFNGAKPGNDEYPAEFYEEFLNYTKSKYQGQYWNVLPKEIARFWFREYSR
ncbi:MAG TPA: hypothetical protein VJ024_03085 [Thermodesulfovibrionales bacterium]|nr:hypothetical protein [Thermodesulfovibrionales bacterium]